MKSRSASRSPKMLVFLVVFIDLLGFGIVVPILSYVAEEYTQGYGKYHWLLIGLFSSAYSLFQMMFAPFWGRLSDHFGRRPIILISLIGSVISYLIFALGGNIWVLLLGRSLGGIMAANISVAQAYMADITPEEDRTGGMGLIGMAFGLGFTFGPVIGVLAIALGNRLDLPEQLLPGMFAASICLINVLWAAKSLPESLPPEKRAARGAAAPGAPAAWRRYASPGEVIRSLGHPLIGPLALVFFLAIMGFSNFEVTLGLYAKEYPELGYKAKQIYLLFVYIGFSLAFFSGYVARKASKVVPESILVIFGIACQVFALAMFPLHPSFGWMIFSSTFIALGQGVGNPAMLSLVSKTAEPGRHGQVMGITQSASSFGRIIGPFVATSLISAAHSPQGLRWPFWAGATSMALALFLAILIRQRILSGPITPEPVS